MRQLYFVLLHLHESFRYVKYGVATILIFTGFKMLGTVTGFHIDNLLSIAIIISVLAISIIVSLIVSKKSKKLQ